MFNRICDLCSDRKISISRLEKELKLGNGTISKWRDSSPSIENLKKVADYFGVTIDYLVGYERKI